MFFFYLFSCRKIEENGLTVEGGFVEYAAWCLLFVYVVLFSSRAIDLE